MKRGKKRKESYSSCQVTTAHPPVSCCITIILAFKQPFYLLFSKYLGFALPAMNCLYALICILNKRLPLHQCWLQSPLLFIPYFVFYRFHLTIFFCFFFCCLLVSKRQQLSSMQRTLLALIVGWPAALREGAAIFISILHLARWRKETKRCCISWKWFSMPFALENPQYWMKCDNLIVNI